MNVMRPGICGDGAALADTGHLKARLEPDRKTLFRRSQV
jgi:hypothetical protein